MNKIKKIIPLLATLLVVPMIFTGCNKKSGELTKVKLAEVTHSVFYAPQYVAMSQGFFKEEGLDIELMAAQGADKTMAALVSGEVDIGLMGPEASIYVFNKGSKDYAVNFAQLTKRDGSFLVSRKDEKNFKIEDLAGKEILGGRKGGVPEMTLEYVIKNKGVKIGENTASGEANVRTDVQFNVMAGSFVAGEGDYVTLFEPAATAMEKQKNGYIVASIGEESGEIPYTAYSATNKYMKDHEEIVQKFTNAIYKGQLYVKNHSSKEIAEAIAPYFTEISKEDLVTVVQRYKDIDAWCDNPVLKEDSLNHLMDVIDTAGELDKRQNYNDIVTTKFAEKTMQNVK